MLPSLGGNLWQVGDGDNLHVTGHVPHDAAHGYGDVARNTAVYLVKDDCRQQTATCDQ